MNNGTRISQIGKHYAPGRHSSRFVASPRHIFTNIKFNFITFSCENEGTEIVGCVSSFRERGLLSSLAPFIYNT